MAKQTVAAILAANVAKILKAKNKPQAVMAKKGVSQATIGRILKGSSAARISTIDNIASHFGYEPWQLLVPIFEPTNPPVLRVAKGREAEFYRRMQQLAAEMGLDQTDIEQ